MTIKFSWKEVEQILREHIKIDTNVFDVHPAIAVANGPYGEEDRPDVQSVEFAVTPKGPEVVYVPPQPQAVAVEIGDDVPF